MVQGVSEAPGPQQLQIGISVLPGSSLLTAFQQPDPTEPSSLGSGPLRSHTKDGESFLMTRVMGKRLECAVLLCKDVMVTPSREDWETLACSGCNGNSEMRCGFA